MAKASPVIAGASWELTRRCDQRNFYLTADRELTRAMLYCAAFTAAKWNIQLHALTLMHNHYHCNLTDVDGTRVNFGHGLHQMLAGCIKRLHSVRRGLAIGPVWDPNEQTGRVLLLSREAHVESIAYTLANPVSAGLVRTLEEWPSFVSRPRDMLERRAITIKRPICLGKPYPETATLQFCVPPPYKRDARTFVAECDSRLQEELRKKRREMKAEGKSFGTRTTMLAVKPESKPKTPKPRNTIKPSFRAVTRDALRLAHKTMREWHTAYRKAFERFRLGERNVVWPPGTWFYRRYAGAKVAPDDRWFPLPSG